LQSEHLNHIWAKAEAILSNLVEDAKYVTDETSAASFDAVIKSFVYLPVPVPTTDAGVAVV